jgi:alginate O-acetyltransferase complex protein AlgI
MLFHTAPFLWLLAVTFVVHWWVLRSRRARNLFLLAASIAFYANWNAWLVVLVASTAVYDYRMARAIEDAPTERARRVRLIAAVAVPLGLLAWFKYTNFLVAQAWPLVRVLGTSAPPPVFDIVLPLGISFYTFETIAYVVDVYHRRMRAERRVSDYALFLLFFPHLIAGPIVRPERFLPQVRRGRRLDWSRVELGTRLFVFGMLKKAVVADQLALIVDPIFAAPGAYATRTIWTGVVCYAVQIYCDFSGYSDMAIGSAHLLGIALPENFRMPYFAANPAEFWRRWHISLSTWLRDYLYIPLGGNRGSKLAGYRNLMLTMLLGGLWHGANWTFVVWGALNGGYLVAGNLTAGLRKRYALAIGLDRAPRLLAVIQVLVTFVLACIAWVFFRARTVGQGYTIVRTISRGLPQCLSVGTVKAGFAATSLSYFDLAVPTLAIVALFAFDYASERLGGMAWFEKRPAWLRWSMYYAAASTVLFLGRFGLQQFIYFQF